MLLKLIESIPEGEPVTLHTLTCRSGLNYRTIRRYLHVIMEIQQSRKVVREMIGMKVLVMKERKGEHDGREQKNSHRQQGTAYAP